MNCYCIGLPDAAEAIARLVRRERTGVPAAKVVADFELFPSNIWEDVYKRQAPTAAPTAKPTAAPTAAPTAVPTATPKPKEKVWVVDVPAKPAQEEQGHWEEAGHWKSDWVYQCNQCGTICSTEADMWDHEGDLSSCWSYTMVSGEKYWVKDGEYWVVDVPAQAAQPEQGHWEYR